MTAQGATEELKRRGRPAAVLWDLDGTLVDSEPLWTVALEEAAEGLGRALTPEVRERMTGTDDRTTMRILAEHTGYLADDAELAALHERIVARVTAILADRVPVMPHATRVLGALSAEGITQALVTSSPRPVAELALARLGAERFATVVTAEDVADRKPDPAPYLLAARRLGVDAADCWAVEDSPSGARAAESAGCAVLLAPTAAPGARAPGRLDLASLAEIGVRAAA